MVENNLEAHMALPVHMEVPEGKLKVGGQLVLERCKQEASLVGVEVQGMVAVVHNVEGAVLVVHTVAMEVQ